MELLKKSMETLHPTKQLLIYVSVPQKEPSIKLQKGLTHCTYQNINASMDFNLNYALTSGPRGGNEQARYPQKRTKECFVSIQS